MTVREPSIAAIHALEIAEAAASLGVPAAPLLASLGLTEAQLAEPRARVPLPTLAALFERARRDTAEPGLGIVLGLRSRVTRHGILGFGVLAAKTLREALEFACRYGPLRTDLVLFSFDVVADKARVSIEERVELGSMRDAFLFSVAIEIWQLGNTITGQSLVGDLELMIPEPEYYSRLMVGAPGSVRFNMPENRLMFDADLLDIPLKAADPAAFSLARESCERDLATLSTELPLRMRLHALLQEEGGCVLSRGEAARALGMSPRSLKRKLAEEGVMYSRLIAEARKQHALRLLQSEASIESVAERLGYSDPTNFARAFRRWTGRAPRVARRDGRNGAS